MAEADTGSPPPGWKDSWLTRPTCQSCRKIRPPAACTASVTFRQPADLGVAMDARGQDVALALRRHLRRLGDDQAGAGALGVVERRQGTRHPVALGARAGHRRHQHAVGQVDRADAGGGEQDGQIAHRYWSSGKGRD